MPTKGTAAFRERVLTVVRAVPRGCVVTYGQVAALIGSPRAARQVGGVLYGLHAAEVDDVPWQRVINASGRISTYKIGSGELQRALLESEGVAFDAEDRVDLGRFRWRPDDGRPFHADPDSDSVV